MKLLGEGNGFKVYDAGGGRVVQFDDNRKRVVYYNMDRGKPEYLEYEAVASGVTNPDEPVDTTLPPDASNAEALEKAIGLIAAAQAILQGLSASIGHKPSPSPQGNQP